MRDRPGGRVPSRDRASHARAVLFAAIVCAPGCLGRIGTRGGSNDAGHSSDAVTPPDGAVVVSSCDDPDPGPAVPLPRLSRAEYVNTVRDVLRATLPPDRATAGIGVLESETALGMWGNRLPDDRRVGVPNAKHGGYRNLDQDVEPGFVQATYEIAIDVSSAVVANASDAAAVLGSCASGTTSPPVSCLQSFIRTFGARAFRRPLSDDDVTFYSSQVHDSTAPGDIADLIALMLTAPEFIYHVEHGDQLVRDDIYRLDPYELAARLSYHFWQTIPDDALIAAADSGALATPAGLSAQVQRLAADPRATAAAADFFQQYLWLDEVPRLDQHVGDADYRAFAGSVTPTATLHAEMERDVVDAALYTFARGGTLEDLFDDRHSFARSPELAAIYGTPVWDGTSPPVEFPQGERVGLITRAAFLVNSTLNTRPIMKGVFIRMGLLCDDIPPPPNNAANTPLPRIDMATTRQLVEALTQTGPPCNGCHTTLLNPLGFATENFDALGRVRAVQTFFDNTGQTTGSAPIDTRSTPYVSPSDTTMSNGAGDLTRLLVANESHKLQACFARQYFRYTFTRIEDTADSLTDTVHNPDACLVTAATDALVAGQPLASVMSLYATRPEFARRRFTQ